MTQKQDGAAGQAAPSTMMHVEVDGHDLVVDARKGKMWKTTELIAEVIESNKVLQDEDSTDEERSLAVIPAVRLVRWLLAGNEAVTDDLTTDEVMKLAMDVYQKVSGSDSKNS